MKVQTGLQCEECGGRIAAQLREILSEVPDMMRKGGVARLRIGDVEIEIGQPAQDFDGALADVRRQTEQALGVATWEPDTKFEVETVDDDGNPVKPQPSDPLEDPALYGGEVPKLPRE